MSHNYGRHILPTKLGGTPKFVCTLRKSEVYMVDCNNCHTPCDYAGHIKDTWCPLYTPAFCVSCRVRCAMAGHAVPENFIEGGPKGYSEYYDEKR